ncbi:MAG: porphobilinogen synthase [Acidimicrobiales bacterium]
MSFPISRPRRLRSTHAVRELVAQTHLSPADFIAPLFVAEGASDPLPIRTLPGVVQHSLASLEVEVDELSKRGVRSVMLFGVPAHKDAVGSGAWDPNGVVQVGLKRLADKFGDEIVLMADLCLDEYTDHGHCGPLDSEGNVENDRTIELYAKVALAQAAGGARFVAPSGMMDGQVGAIRRGLDDAGRTDVGILAYSVKYASALYGPFREAVNVEIAGGGDRKSYQQDYRNVGEALREVRLDIEEGADMVMVKPAGAYLDVIGRVASEFEVPVAAYQVSGEYAMIKGAASLGYLDGDAVAVESLTAIKRAGADLILTYLAKEVAEQLQ